MPKISSFNTGTEYTERRTTQPTAMLKFKLNTSKFRNDCVAGMYALRCAEFGRHLPCIVQWQWHKWRRHSSSSSNYEKWQKLSSWPHSQKNGFAVWFFYLLKCIHRNWTGQLNKSALEQCEHWTLNNEHWNVHLIRTYLVARSSSYVLIHRPCDHTRCMQSMHGI